MSLSLRSIRCRLPIPLLDKPSHCAPQRHHLRSTSANSEPIGVRQVDLAASIDGNGEDQLKHEKEIELEERGGTAPNGQVLPDWLTYLSYVTTINEMPYTVETIAALPLTYYGPSIPLGDRWTYGGLTSPTGTIGLAPPATETEDGVTPQATADPNTATTTPDPEITSKSTSAPIPEVASGASSATPQLSTSASQASPSQSPTASASASLITTSSPLVSTVSSPTSASSGLAPVPTFSDPAPSPSNGGSEEYRGRNLLAPLLATLLPLGIILLIILIFYCIYQKNRHSRDSGLFGALRPRSILFTGYKFTKFPPKASDVAPVGATAGTGGKSPRADPTLIGGVKSPDEKSALLPGFTAQHHRSSSSISTNIERRQEMQVDGELRDLVRQNQSLLQRLTLGLGWLTPSNNSSSSSVPKIASSSKGRVTSGNTLEKGGGGRRISSSEASVMAAGVFGWGKARIGQDHTGTGGGVGHTPSEASSAGYERVLDDDQLFYLPPRNQSSTGSRSRTGSATGSPSIPTTGASSNSHPNRHSGQRRSWVNPNSSLKEENGGGSGSRTFSVGVPETPGLEDVDLGDAQPYAGGLHSNSETRTADGEEERVTQYGGARWSDTGDRMRFPIPPGLGLYEDGTFGGDGAAGRRTGLEGDDAWRRESYMSSETQYYSAQSRSSEDRPHSYADFNPSSGDPIPRDSEGYRHASVSAFGSHPATPTRPARSIEHEHSSVSLQSPRDGSNDHNNDSPVRLISPFSTPSRYDSPRTDETLPATAARVRMSYLFSPTPEPRRSEDTGGSGGGNDSRDSRGDDARENRRSYSGQPLVDESLRSPHRGIGEFGEPLRRPALLSPTLVPSVKSPHSSESGSLGLIPSIAHTHSSSSHYSHATSASGGQGSTKDLSEVSHEQGLRGQRSRGRLVRASVIAGKTGTGVSADLRAGSPGQEGEGGTTAEEALQSPPSSSRSKFEGAVAGGKWLGRWRG
ncbi:hypothetical protein I316_04057 [Kwoniella heveanensis BCC8398]|uniref:Uncharacterized protein n=1 Tax=Kwoniella heveanensis BCC8398 TaxID=1296120 RepID=A0A1B9GSR4_9TREE|nr:hypothetical protein I316_04057 [Kwoniella heveanensis BCC8398]